MMTGQKIREILLGKYRDDPDYAREQAKTNRRAVFTCAAVVVGISIAGLIGILAQRGSVESYFNVPACAVYTVILVINLLSMCTAGVVLRKYGENRPVLANRIFCAQLMIVQFSGIFCLFSTQNGSSLYIETLLILFPVAFMPAYPTYHYIINYVVIGAVSWLILAVHRVEIAWQDEYDLFIFLILCFIMAVYRRGWFDQRYEATRELKESNEKLYIKSRTDEGTGLFNSSAMVEDLPAFSPHNICAAIIDIDGFRAYKESHGETEAVSLLQSLAQSMKNLFHDRNERAYRYGVDEILLLVKHMPRAEFAERIEVLQNDFALKNPDMTATIGYCTGRAESDREVRAMITAADNILFKAKAISPGTILETSDFSGSRKAEEYDALTGMLTTGAFIKQMDAQQLTEDMYVIFLDLDRFQQLNKEYGFRTGDRILKALSDWIGEEFPGDIVSRENDHFAVLTKVPDYEARIRRIQQKLSAFEGKIYVRLRAGVYPVTEKGASLGARACVDMAKYASDSLRGKTGIGIRVYDDELDRQRENRTFVQSHFYEAIDKGYIVPYFQPIIASLSGVCAGFEALARWIDPDQGFLNPGIFVPVLEESHEAYFLDFHILKQVCTMLSKQDLTTWNKYVSVNFSRTDFESCDLPARVDAIVQSYGIPKDMLRLEVTESAFSDSPQIREDIKRLEDMGYLVWLDDFGSGMSSLNTLKNFKVNAAKIDLEFLRNSEGNSRALTILAQMIRLCHSIDTIALVEGVETKDQLEFVRQCGGNLIQGFYYDKPQTLEAPELQDFMSQSIAKEEYDYYAKAAFIDINKSADVMFGGEQISDITFQIEKRGDSLMYLRISDGAYRWAEKYGFEMEQRHVVTYSDENYQKAFLSAVEDAIQNDRRAYVDISMPDGTPCWACISIVSRLPGSDRVILMISIVNHITPTVQIS